MADQARAARDGAAQAYQNALKALKNPQLLDAQVIQAQAARDSAQRALAQVQAGNRPEDIAAAEAALAQAQANLQSNKDRLSAAKTTAETQVQQSALALTQAQARFALATSNWFRSVCGMAWSLERLPPKMISAVLGARRSKSGFTSAS